jgi:hypothetical protein
MINHRRREESAKKRQPGMREAKKTSFFVQLRSQELDDEGGENMFLVLGAAVLFLSNFSTTMRRLQREDYNERLTASAASDTKEEIKGGNE